MIVPEVPGGENSETVSILVREIATLSIMEGIQCNQPAIWLWLVTSKYGMLCGAQSLLLLLVNWVEAHEIHWSYVDHHRGNRLYRLLERFTEEKVMVLPEKFTPCKVGMLCYRMWNHSEPAREVFHSQNTWVWEIKGGKVYLDTSHESLNLIIH